MIIASRTALPRNTDQDQSPRYTTARWWTLAVFGQWARFARERAFYRYALRHLRAAFPRCRSVSNSIACNGALVM